MKRAVLYFIVIVSFLSALACQELITLPLNEGQKRIVIEGLITDKVGRQSVRISQSINYYDTGELPPVQNAEVSLLSNEGLLIEEFTYSDEDSTYVPGLNFVAEAEKDYILQVVANEEVYQAKGRLITNAKLDSIYYQSFNQLEDSGKNVFEGDYFIFVDGSLNSDDIEYFRLTVTVNDTLRNSRGELANSILSSEILNKEFRFQPVPGSFAAEDSVQLALYSLTEDTYQYYLEFSNLLFNDGGIFSPPPVNPSSNIINTTNADNYPLGFVQFSTIIEKAIYIDEEK